MALPNPKDFAYVVAEDIQSMLNLLRNLEAEFSDIIEIVETNELYYFRDKTQNNFYFYVGIPDKKSNGNPTLYKINYGPSTRNNKSSLTSEVSKSDVVDNFYHWIDIVKDFNSINFNYKKDFLKIYEEEIYSDFENIDDDTDEKPFDTNQQVILYKFLEATIIYLNNKHPDNKDIEEIIAESNSLKNEIPSLTKRIASKRFSKVLAKIKKYNPITFKEVYDVAKKEVIKYLLLKGVDTLPKLVNVISNILGS